MSYLCSGDLSKEISMKNDSNSLDIKILYNIYA